MSAAIKAKAIVEMNDALNPSPPAFEVVTFLNATIKLPGNHKFASKKITGNLHEIFFNPIISKYTQGVDKDIRFIHSAVKEKWGYEMSPDDLREINNAIDRVKSRNPLYSKDGTPYKNSYEIDPSSQRLNTSSNYTEWTVRTPGVGGRAERRIVLDMNTGKAYYSHDHYKNFIQINL